MAKLRCGLACAPRGVSAAAMCVHRALTRRFRTSRQGRRFQCSGPAVLRHATCDWKSAYNDPFSLKLPLAGAFEARPIRRSPLGGGNMQRRRRTRGERPKPEVTNLDEPHVYF